MMRVRHEKKVEASCIEEDQDDKVNMKGKGPFFQNLQFQGLMVRPRPLFR
jgi:hypothetical protein